MSLGTLAACAFDLREEGGARGVATLDDSLSHLGEDGVDVHGNSAWLRSGVAGPRRGDPGRAYPARHVGFKRSKEKQSQGDQYTSTATRSCLSTAAIGKSSPAMALSRMSFLSLPSMCR